MSISIGDEIRMHLTAVQGPSSRREVREGVVLQFGRIWVDVVSAARRLVIRIQHIASMVFDGLLRRLPLMIEALQLFRVGIEKLKESISPSPSQFPNYMQTIKQIVEAFKGVTIPPKSNW